ncbi:MAG: ABC transporter permease [Planctomycetota bacterium]|nr:ABC transporter permease [Planctomycetota bacterium]
MVLGSPKDNSLARLVFIIAAMAYVLLFVWAMKDNGSGRRFERTDVHASLMPPSWWKHSDLQQTKIASLQEVDSWYSWLGTDQLGRDVLSRCIVGGGISIGVGIFAAFIAVILGTTWGTIAGCSGGKIDATMMRAVDILYGLPSIMLVVLIVVSASSLSEGISTTSVAKEIINVIALLAGIGIVSWLTVSRVIRGQVRSIVSRSSIEACRVMGIGPVRTFTHHIFPALLGTIVVYATLTVPAAILSEAFLSFLGIGVREPLPSWGNLAADGLSQLNPVHSRWWLLVWPCVCIATTLVAMNWLGQSVQRQVDPKGLVD